MNYLAPSILAADFCNLGAQLDIIKKAGAPYIHVDIMDGMFVPSISFGMPVLSCVRKYTELFLDVHMMVEQPQRYVDELISLGADGVTIHVEACDCVGKTLERIKELGARRGIALNPETPVEKVLPYLEQADMVLVMTVHPGFGGQSYISECFEKIRCLRNEIEKRKLDVDIEVDGGIHLENLKENTDAGANVIVAGSAIFRDDIDANIKAFLKIMEEKHVKYRPEQN